MAQVMIGDLDLMRWSMIVQSRSGGLEDSSPGQLHVRPGFTDYPDKF